MAGCRKNSSNIKIIIASGAAIGLLNLIHYLLSQGVTGAERFGIFPGGTLILAPMWLTGKLTTQFKAIVILGLGIIAGSMIVSVITGRLSLASLKEPALDRKTLFRAISGGLLMGFGLLLAEGCLVRHTLTGVPTLQLSSMVSLAGMVAGMWAGIRLMSRAS